MQNKMYPLCRKGFIVEMTELLVFESIDTVLTTDLNNICRLFDALEGFSRHVTTMLHNAT